MRGVPNVFSAMGSPFRRNFMRMARASVLAQAMGLAAAPFLSRLYHPADFAVFALFTSVSGLAAAVCTWRFDWLVPNARNAVTAAALMVLGFLALAAIIPASLCIVATIHFLAPDWLAPLDELSFLIPVFLLGAGTIQMLEGWYVRSNDLHRVSNARVAQSIAAAVLAIGGGALKSGPIGLIAATVIAGWVGIGGLRLGAAEFWFKCKRLSAMHLRATFRRFIAEATWSSLSALINVTGYSALVIALTANYPANEVGWYAFIYRLAAAPITLVSTSLGQSFWSAAADLARKRDIAALHALYLKTTRHLAWLVIPIVIGCACGPFVVGPLLGRERWGEAGILLPAMAPMLIGVTLFSPTNHLVALGRQSLQLVADLIRLVLSVGAVVICGHAGFGIAAAVAGASLASLLGYVILFYTHLRAHAA